MKKKNFNNQELKKLVKDSLLNLANGRANDAVRLAFADELPDGAELDKMDLYNISEIKRVKGGGVEIKFADRQKALEKIYELADRESSENSVKGLIEQLMVNNE